jgi:hypothetical protein
MFQTFGQDGQSTPRRVLPPLRLPLMKLLRGACDYTRSSQRLCATNPRDYVCGLLEASSDSEKLGFIPDYSKLCSEVYTEVMESLIKTRS